MEKTAAKILREQNQEKLTAFQIKEQEEAEIRKACAIKSLQFLLKKSLKFADIIKQAINKETVQIDQDNNGNKPKSMAEAIKEEEPSIAGTVSSKVELKLKYFEGGTLKPYQVEGVTWLSILFENGINGILADEMGLGKTIQVIALLCHLYEMTSKGPHLILVPLSTLSNWISEFKKFAPRIPIFVFYGDKEERVELKEQYLSKKFYLNKQLVQPVVLTSYETPFFESGFFVQHKWRYLIIDEGHRIKNHDSQLAKMVRKMSSTNRLILTGTPLQNQLTELWALLNFLLPHIFCDKRTFASLCLMEQIDNKGVSEESSNIISTIHKVLTPFMLRRMKKDVLINLPPKKDVIVYCPLTKLQMDLYKFTLEKNINMLQGKEEAEEVVLPAKRIRKCINYATGSIDLAEDEIDDMLTRNDREIATKINMGHKAQNLVCRLTMQNPMTMFKKIVNHPYLIQFPLNPNSEKRELLIDENLVKESGKMLVLDAMLAELKKRGHKVLLFSTLTMVLDLIEEFTIMRGYRTCRLDGNIKFKEREEMIEQFNTDPNTFIFLMSTKAGGLGLNLVAADTVILYDSDWNPQNDIQAKDRCHRIGQTKPVMVYTLVTKNTIDEQIMQVANLKQRLGKVIIKDGTFKSITSMTSRRDLNFEELKKLLKSTDSKHTIHSNGFVFSKEELDELLDRSQLLAEMNNY